MELHSLTLESVLESENEYCDNFIMYLHHTYCIENYNFWQDVQVYKLKPTFTKYQKMIKTYILANAPQEINIPCDMRQDLLNNHTPDCFDQAAESILELIRVNSFLPWYQETYAHQFKSTKNRSRKSISTSTSFPDRWNLLFKQQQKQSNSSDEDDEGGRKEMFTTRPSFASLRVPKHNNMMRFTSTSSMFDFTSHQTKSKSKISDLFQRKRQALFFRVKKTFVQYTHE